MLTLALFLQVDRLMELHFKYLEAVQLADKRIEGEKHVRFTHTHSRLIGSISSARADLGVKIRADLPDSNVTVGSAGRTLDTLLCWSARL